MPEKNVTAILVTFNSASVVTQALQALKDDALIGEIIIADNASTDDTCARIRQACPQAHIIQNSKNEGFGRGNNIALANVTTEFALLVNPDAVMGTGALAELVAAAKRNPEAALLAPKLLNEDGSIQPSHKTGLYERESYKTHYVNPEGDICADFLSGALWLVRMEALKKVGMFDPEIFFYYEDDDMCMRLRAAGYALLLVSAASATHASGTSSIPSDASRAFRLYHDTWSRLYIEYKYRGAAAARKMAQEKLGLYRLRLGLGKAFFIRALVKRYGPRLEGARDFSAYLAARGH